MDRPELTLNQTNYVSFVMIDATGVEVTGLGNGFTLEVSKVSAAFVGSAGTKGEISDGWYYYITAAGECDTRGPLNFRVTGAGCLQQNLVYFVGGATAGAVEFTYTVTDSSTGLPIEGVEVWITTDVGGVNIVWVGSTDALGVARDTYNSKCWLDAGDYYFWSQKAGYTFANPDLESVS